jgi:ElaB/YqjD/DUF883 family membrane-anchored ribosome-binding protein
MAKEGTLNEFENVAQDAEELLQATADNVGEKATAIRERLAAALEAAKSTAQNIQQQAVRGAKATDEFVHEKPYYAMGIAFGVGLALGFLIKRK